MLGYASYIFAGWDEDTDRHSNVQVNGIRLLGPNKPIDKLKRGAVTLGLLLVVVVVGAEKGIYDSVF